MAKTKTVEKQKENNTLAREMEVRKRIEELDTQTDKGFIKLADLLSEAYHSHYYTSWGYSDFPSYIKEELNIHYRKAMHLVNIMDTINALNIPIEKAEELGWTKLRELMRVANAGNIKELLEKASSMSQRDIVEQVKLLKEKDLKNANVPITRTLKIVMGEDTGEIVEDALKVARELAESDSNAIALSMICQDWMSNQDQIPVKTPLKTLIGYIEKTYGVKVTVNNEGEAKEEVKAEEVVEEPPKEEKKTKAPAKKGKGKAKKADKEPEAKEGKPLTETLKDVPVGDNEPSIDELIGL